MGEVAKRDDKDVSVCTRNLDEEIDCRSRQGLRGVSGSQLSQFPGERADFVCTSVSRVGCKCVRGFVQHAGSDLERCVQQLHDGV